MVTELFNYIHYYDLLRATHMRTTLAYALLTTHFNEGSRSPLDILDHVVSRTLLLNGAKQFRIFDVQNAVYNDWGISVPLNVLRYCIGRLRSQGLINNSSNVGTDDDKFTISWKPAETDAIKLKEKLARESYNRLIKKIRLWLAREPYTDNLDPSDVIDKWLDESAISFLGGTASARSVARLDHDINRVIVGSGRLLDTSPDEEFLSDLSQLALGDTLYRSLVEILSSEAPATDAPLDSSAKAMSAVDVFLDVGILFRAAGYFGDKHSPAALEFIKMCKDTGCRLKTFRHTADEMAEGIAAVADLLRMRPSSAHGPVVSYAMENGLTAADLLREASESDDRIIDLGISIVDKPPYDQPLNIDELDLDYRIETDVRQDNPIARKRDVDSLASIFRLRQGNGRDKLEQCDAILITHNKSLSDAAHRYFRRLFDEQSKKNVVQLCMTDVVFATRLWTKLPTGAKWIPRNQIISYAIANLVPNESVKRKFQENLERLLSEAKLTEEQALRVRYSRFTERMLALHYRNPDDLDSKAVTSTINAVLQAEKDKLREATSRGYAEGLANAHQMVSKIRNDIGDENNEEIDNIKRELAEFESDLKSYEQQLAIQEGISSRLATFILDVIFVSLFFGVAIGGSTYFGLALGWPSAAIALASSFVLAGFTWWGFTRKACRDWMKSIILSRALRRTTIPDRTIE